MTETVRSDAELNRKFKKAPQNKYKTTFIYQILPAYSGGGHQDLFETYKKVRSAFELEQKRMKARNSPVRDDLKPRKSGPKTTSAWKT